MPQDQEHNLKDHMQYGGASVVEREYIADIIDDIQSDQLDIAVSTTQRPS